MELEDIIAKVLVENNVQHCVVLAKKIADALRTPPPTALPAAEPVVELAAQPAPVVAVAPVAPVDVQNSVVEGVDKTANP